MFLKFDRFGRNFMFGRIPGSVLAKKQRQVNFVNIHSVGCNPSSIDYVKPHLPILNNSEVANKSINELPIFWQSEFFDANELPIFGQSEFFDENELPILGMSHIFFMKMNCLF